jgi:hypothetical protein
MRRATVADVLPASSRINVEFDVIGGDSGL